MSAGGLTPDTSPEARYAALVASNDLVRRAHKTIEVDIATLYQRMKSADARLEAIEKLLLALGEALKR